MVRLPKIGFFKPPTLLAAADLYALMEVDGQEDNQNLSSAAGEWKVKSQKVKEGSFLLGSPTFVDLGNGHWRCEETGHDLFAKEMESYSRTKACRLALIDAALSKKRPILNMFQPHPISKSMLVCSLTGYVINKSEEHIWKHINGRRFLRKLEEKELEKLASPEKIKNSNKKERKKTKLKASSIQKNQNLGADRNGSLAREPETESTDAEEPSFWVPSVGERWDFDDGRDRWESHNFSDQETEANDNTQSVMNERNEAKSMELSMCTKRLSIAVGPTSFARRKKKMKKT